MSQKYETLKTAYGERMNKSLPFSDYPRPGMVRGSYFSLNGEWSFAVGDESKPETYGKILVPFPPESYLSGYEKEIPKGKFLHYKRSFSLPAGFARNRVLLHFGAVDTIAEVYINSKPVVTHEGGYLPFSADITDALIAGENEIYVRVLDDLSGLYPYGKQKRDRGGMWYTPVSGIWQSVWLESVAEVYIRSFSITTNMHSAKIEVSGGEDVKRLTLKDSGEIFEWRGACCEITPKDIKLWSPESPYLYEFTLESGEDRVEGYFALREIGISECGGVPRLTLNGKPYLFNGLLDQGYFPDGIFLPATPEGYLDDILTAKSLGFNMLRKHIKIEPEIFYYLCDKHGMVVFQDMVNNSGYSFIFDTALPTVGMKSFPDNLLHRNKQERDIFTRHALMTVEHLRNFPSVLYYTIFNEGWGQFCADEMYEKIKAKDQTRIVDSTSGWFKQKKSDVDSRHVYFKAVKLGRTDGRPIVISEFGGYSYRALGHLYGDNNYGYRIFDDERKFEDAFIKLYSEEIAPLIPKGVCALVYTQLSDVEDETNGVLTYDRRHLKLTPERIAPIMKALSESI